MAVHSVQARALLESLPCAYPDAIVTNLKQSQIVKRRESLNLGDLVVHKVELGEIDHVGNSLDRSNIIE